MHDLGLLPTVAAAFGAAWVFGLITQKLGLSPIVGYLLAGISIGPHTPGFIGDPEVAEQLAKIGVILLMFGVGLHFRLGDLLSVRGIAVPGAVGQSAVATALTALVVVFMGWSLRSGLVLGMALAVASTVVLMRMLDDRRMLHTTQGRVAVGWLVVEDIFTVLLLVLLPMMAEARGAIAGGDLLDALLALGWAMLKLSALVAIVLLAGSRVVPWILVQVARLRSRELFTLTVLVIAISIAVGSASIFDSSIELGAFLAGMVVGRSPTSHQAAADALPLRDAFAVLFFVSIGMLLDPTFLAREPMLVGLALAIVLVAKPLTALMIVLWFGHSLRTALTVAVGLAQIGEFSFILGTVAVETGSLPSAGMNVLVATAIVSIAVNPIAFKSIEGIERWVARRPRLARLLAGRIGRRMAEINARSTAAIAASERPFAIIVGYGPVGRLVDALLRDSGLETVIVDLNADTIRGLDQQGRRTIYGDASRLEILERAGVRRASQIVLTLPHSADRVPVLMAAKELNPGIEVTVRARYLAERDALRQAGATTVVFEEGEAGMALARHVMRNRGIDEATTERLVRALRRMWAIGGE